MMLIATLIAGAAVMLLGRALATQPGRRRWVNLIIHGSVLLMLGVPMLVRLAQTQIWISQLTHPQHFATQVLPMLPILLGMLAFFAAGGWLLARRPLGRKTFLLGVFVPVFLLVRVLFLVMFDQQRFSDFDNMWVLVSRVAQEGSLLLPHDFVDPPALRLLYLRRILPVWSPLALVFGDTSLIYKIPNLVFLLAAGISAFILADRYFGRQAAQLTGWILIFIPELTFSVGVPSHDLLGVSFLVIFLYFYDQVLAHWQKGRLARAAGWGVGAGLLWLLVDLQRDYGIFILVGVLLFVMATLLRHLIVAWRVRRWAITSWALVGLIFWLLVPLGTFKLGGELGKAAGLFQTRDQSPFWTYIFTTIDNEGGGYDAAMVVQDRLTMAEATMEPPAGRAYWDQFYRDAILSEYYHNNLRYLPQWIRRSERFLHLGDPYFYLTRPTEQSRIQLGSRLHRVMLSINFWFTPVFLLLALAGLTRMVGMSRWRWRAYPPLIVLAAFIFIVLLIAEVQPRYAYPLWLILPIYLGAPLARWLGGSNLSRFNRMGLGWGFCLTIFLMGSFFLAAMALFSGAPGKMISQREWVVESSPADDPQQRAHARPYSHNLIRLLVGLPRQHQPADWTRAWGNFKIGPAGSLGRLTAMLHIPGYQVDGVEELLVRLFVNGHEVRRFFGNELAHPKFVTVTDIEANAEGEAQLALEVRALGSYSGPNWQQQATVSMSHIQLKAEPIIPTGPKP